MNIARNAQALFLIMMARFFAVLLLFINAQIFFVSAANPLGIYGVQEVFFVFLIAYTIYYFLSNSGLPFQLAKTDLFVLGVVCFFICISTLLSYFQYGQPFLWGLVESRLILANLVYFPLKRLMERGGISSEFILKTILYITYLIVFFDALYQLDFFPKELFPTEIKVGNDDVRSDRTSVGRFYLITCFIYTLVMYVQTNSIRWGAGFLVFLYAIFFMLQERQSMLALALISILYVPYKAVVNSKIRSLINLLFLIFVSVGAFFVLFQSKVENIRILIVDRLLSDSAEAGVRLHTISVMISELQKSGWIGHGALSLLWNDGFQRFYGDTFYIGDVGIIGTFFRFGFLAVPVIIVVSYFLYASWWRMSASIGKDIVGLSLLYCIFTLPTSAPIEYRGYFIAIILILSLHNRFYSQSKEEGCL